MQAVRHMVAQVDARQGALAEVLCIHHLRSHRSQHGYEVCVLSTQQQHLPVRLCGMKSMWVSGRCTAHEMFCRRRGFQTRLPDKGALAPLVVAESHMTRHKYSVIADD